MNSNKTEPANHIFSGIVIYPLSLFLITLLACNGNVKTKEQAAEPKAIAAPQPPDTPEGDPQFIMPKAVVSAYGPHSITRNVLQDINGNVWLASWEGIVCYTGSGFTNYTLKQNLVRFHVMSILEDKNHNLWFGMVGGGAYKYDGKNFTLYTISDGLAGNAVMCMLEDRTGNIWFGTTTGVSRFDGNAFHTYTVKDGLSGNSIFAIAEDPSGKIWFGGVGGVNHYLAGKGFTNFTIDKNTSFHNVHSLVVCNSPGERNGNMWIASDEGLYLYNPSSGVLTNLKKNFNPYLTEDKNGNLWMSGSAISSSGMNLTLYDGKEFKELFVKNDRQQPLNNQVFGLAEDRDGNIWFGSAIGAFRYDHKSMHDFSEKSLTEN